MQERKRVSPWMIIAIAALIALLVAAVFVGRNVRTLNAEVQWAKSLTPTPIPAYDANVMQVTPDPNAPTPAPVIRTGSQGESVWALQERLQALGYYTGTVDGQFGPATQAAVILFQQQHDLDADGIVGTATSEMLYSDQAHMVIVTPSPTPAPTLAREAGKYANGMPMLVNRENLLPDSYEPVDLVNMSDYCDDAIVTIKGSEILGERVAVDALMTMLQAAHQQDITVWQVSAGYRTIEYQQKLFDEQVYAYRQQGFSGSQARSATRKTVADPGASEHHLGLAFDITVPGVSFKFTEQAQWLAEHCWEYGFILRYTEEKEAVTGYVAEPWHFRYVGVEHSIPMRDQGLCLEEYLEQYGNLT
ncbi:MAG: D-alanyl-D-alanine carboxypeptidase family protein [Clostridia bacterium]|nr:D-alanyl-D-alanine carboxypeptidase family protein [Clostridia bacterium]